MIDVLSREMEAATDLPIGWYEVLLHLQEAPRGRLRMHQLAESMLSSRSATTRFVDRMETAGLVERIVCPTDRRGLELVMTERGRALFHKAGRIHLQGIEKHFSRYLTESEAAVIEAALGRVLEAAEKSPISD